MRGSKKQVNIHRYWEKKIYKDVKCSEIQLDEFWSFVAKKQYNLSEKEKLSDEIGDMWTFTALLPAEKLIVGHVLGKRTLINARKLLAQVKSRSSWNEKGKLFITSDGNEDYISAISAVYGRLNAKTKELELPTNLCYAQVIKTIEKGRCKKVKQALIFGDQELLNKCLKKSSVSYQVNTFAVERSNLTLRQHNHRIERKSQGFSKKLEYMMNHNHLSINYYNLCLRHSSLTQYEGGKPIAVTPAMAAGITDHKWSMEELLSTNRSHD